MQAAQAIAKKHLDSLEAAAGKKGSIEPTTDMVLEVGSRDSHSFIGLPILDRRCPPLLI
jgi:hypothetical protein